MLLRNLAFVSLLLLPIGLCNAQSAPAMPVEPTANGIIYRLDPNTQELKKLPDEQWDMWYGFKDPRKVFIGVEGRQSSFRMKAGEIIEFVFKTGTPKKVNLYLLDRKKDKREVQIRKLSIMRTVLDHELNGLLPIQRVGGQLVNNLPIEVSKYGESSYKLVPASPLTPGEYAIVIAEEVYSFGVD